jgi:hypothetical protein
MIRERDIIRMELSGHYDLAERLLSLITEDGRGAAGWLRELEALQKEDEE